MNLKEFVDPPRQYRPSPFWSWNDVLDPTEIENRIRDMKRNGFGGFVMHARQGLRTRYLSDEWMRAIRRAVEVARDQEIEAWLSDEDREPSGFAGGKTTEGCDANLAMVLVWTSDAVSLAPDLLERAIAFTRRSADGGRETFAERPDDLTGIGVFYEQRYSRGDARFNGEGYPDLLNPETVSDFIETTHERYSKLFRYDFGRFMPGIFTNCPTVSRVAVSAQGSGEPVLLFPWTTGFAEYFEKIHGYSPVPRLHDLLGGSAGFAFRHDYWRTVAERFIESFSAPVAAWCAEREFLFAGPYAAGEGFRDAVRTGGTAMAHAEYLDIPSVDHRGCRIGAPRRIKEIASVANQLGKKRVAGEIFGGSRHDLSFADMKWIADSCLALGVTFVCPSLVQYSLRGDAKRDLPPTLSYHQPYGEHLRVMNDYLGRATWTVSRGVTASETLVLHPLGSAYGAFEPEAEDGGELLRMLESSFDSLVNEFVAEHIGFDLGEERILIAHGKARGNVLNVGKMQYRAVVMPVAYTWLASTLDLLDSFTGPVILLGEVPGRVSGAVSDRLREFARRPNVRLLPDDPAGAVTALSGKIGRPLSVNRPDGTTARPVLVNHRREAGAHVLFLANTDRNEPVDVVIELDALGGVVELDPRTGRGYRYASERSGNRTIIRTMVDSAGSRVFLVDQTQTSVEERRHEKIPTEKVLEVAGPYSFTRRQDNMLVLDRCTLEMDGRVLCENAPMGEARDAVRERTGIAEYAGYQPWVLEARNVRTRTNKTVLTFAFEVRDIPDKLELAMESADRFTVEINGKTVESVAGKWHLDRGFSAFVITDHVVTGRNVIRATTDFLWDTEIENLYLAGAFAVGAESDGFPIISEPETLGTGDWVTQGYPFYSGTMTYRLEFTLDRIKPYRYELDLTGAKGSLFTVTVNGTDVGSLAFPPYRGDISGALLKRNNTLEVDVVGSLHNVLGAGEFVPYGFITEPKLIRIG